MELLFVNKNFHYIRVIPVKNGSAWTLEAMAKQVDTLFRARNFHGDYVIVWIDREKRDETSGEITATITNVLVGAGFPADRIAVMACDRMTENVILADEEFVRAEFGLADYAYQAEGRGGKHILKDLYLSKNVTYKETVHGVAALKKIRLDRSAAVSASVSSFREKLAIDCWWFA